MYGAILGDIVGSPYEFDCNNYKAKDFPLFSRRSDFTDDTVMTLAVAKALLSSHGQDDAVITGSIAEAFYGVPEELRHECRKRLPPELAEILREWESALYNETICGRI